MLNGRDYVTPDDVKGLFIPVCAHRVVSKTYLHNGDAQRDGAGAADDLDQVPARGDAVNVTIATCMSDAVA